MKKSLILVGMLSIGCAYAQQGTVGINTTNPQATLDIQPNTENAKATATTNQGIIAPRLSKERIANIADANLVEGTLVYATDDVYAGSNTKVSKITEKGYYFYNGMEWVRGTNSNIDTNIYTTNGTLTEARTVNMNGNNLMFTGNGSIGIGTNDPTLLPGAFNIVGDGVKTDDIEIHSFSNSAKNENGFSGETGTLYFNRYRGVPSGRATVQVGDDLGSIYFRGYNGSTLLAGNYIMNPVREISSTSLKSDLVLYTSNNLGINVWQPITPLDVAGNFIMARGTGGEMAYIGGDGVQNDIQVGSLNPSVTLVTLHNATTNTSMDLQTRNLTAMGNITANSVVQTSDARFKQDVQPISDATATLNGLRSVTYHWNKEGKAKGGNDARQYGFIAQEVEKVLPALVNTDVQGYKSINYIGIIPVLVKALQEKEAKIQELEARLEKLEKILNK